MLQPKYILKIFTVLFFCLFVACNKDKEGGENSVDAEENASPTVVIGPPKENIKSQFTNIDFEIFDQNENELFEVGEELGFYISMSLKDTKSRKFKWQFGDGRESILRSPIHIYKETGKHLVTLKLDEKIVREKIIDIQKLNQPQATDTIVQIYGPREGIVGQELVFRAHGTGVSDWIWEFGDPPGLISSESDGQLLHKYEEAGEYIVKVTTNMSEYPVIHKISILPAFEPFMEEEVVDTLALYGDEIRAHLQKIADAPNTDFQTFDKEKNYILDKFICDVKNVVMIINGSRYNDFISYCLGIHHLYSKDDESLLIGEVVIDTIACVKKMEVTEVPILPDGM